MARENPYLPPSLPYGGSAEESRGFADRLAPPIRERGSIGSMVGGLVGAVATAGFTAALIVLLHLMLEITSQGGFCANGGPYIIATECSTRVGLLTPLSIIALVAFVALGIVAGGAGTWTAALAWPALFCTLGGGFVYSTRYPQFGSVGYVIGTVFLLMGGIPLLLVAYDTARRALRASAPADPAARSATAVVDDPEPDAGVIPAVRHATTFVLFALGVVAGWYLADLLLSSV